MKSNLTIVIESLLKHFKVSNDATETEVSLKSHPDYPALKSLCDTVEEFGFKTYPTKVTVEQLKEIEGSFVAHVIEEGEKVCAFVKEYSLNTVEYFSDSKRVKKVSTDAFHISYTGIVVQLEKTNEAEKIRPIKTPDQNLALLLPYGLIGTFIFYFLWHFTTISNEIFASNYLVILTATKLAGLAITGILVYRDWFADTSFGERVCKSGKNINCNTVLNSRFSEVYSWLKWSDLGFIYFLASLLIVANGNAYNHILQALSLLASVYIFISVYQQGFLIRKWCLFCLGILAVLLIEAIMSLTLSWQLPAIGSIITSFVYFFLIGTATLLLKQQIRTQHELKEQTINYKKHKRDPEVFKALWLNEQKIKTPDSPYNILLGNRSRFALRITVFLSLTCKYCGETFYSLKEILEKQPELCVHIVPVISNTKDKTQAYFIGILFDQYRNGDTWKAYNTLEGWYQGEFHKDVPKALPDITHVVRRFIDQNKQHAVRNQIGQFPSLFLQSKLKPSGYTLGEVLEFKEILNRPILSRIPNNKEMIINT